MIKNNKYLRELGIKDENLPGIYIKDYKNDDANIADPRNQDMKEFDFCTIDFFSLDHTFDLLIYPRLCYFREYCLCGYPMGMTAEKWTKILDDMIFGFKLRLTRDFNTTDEERKSIEKGIKLFAKYYGSLWY